ncbi:MAG: ASKHA domain-containing protein, partial [Anaerovorax sp.]
METLNNRCTGLCETCGKCKGANLLDEMNDRKTKMIFMPDDFMPDQDQEQYGIAFDIGTTTVVGMLWDLKENKMIGNMAMTNPQNEFGADVISRIQYCSGDPNKFKMIRDKIIRCLNDLIGDLCNQNNIAQNQVVRVTVGGNTTMSHIFGGYDPKTLAVAPFEPAYVGLKEFTANEVGLEIGEKARVILVPNIAGHVGGDITAGIVATRLMKLDGLTLFIDIGTNGEIVLSTKDKTVACSTAAGPAFEGASIYQGMRAAAGAIERIKIEDGKVLFKTIENCEPVGICGSGLIDAMGEMFKTGIIKKNGKLLMPEELKDEKLKDEMGQRLRKTGEQKEFVLVFKEQGKDIVITQKDIREVQLAK